MIRTYLFMAAALSCVYFSSCNPNQSDRAQKQKVESLSFDKQWAKSFIDSTNTKFAEQIASGDSVALAANYWPDAELMLDNSETVKGNDIINAWGSALRMGLKEMTFTTTDITGSPTFVIETGNYEMKDAKKSLIDRVKCVVV